MAIPTRRNLVIGLGGTGLSTVYALKRKYLATHGTTTPPATRFLVIDTTPAQPVGGIGLLPSEFQQLSVSNAAEVVRQNRQVADWFPKEPTVSLGAISSGAGQLRPLGRLALFHNQQALYAKIGQQIKEVTGIPTDHQIDGFRITDHPGIVVNIVGSFSGGTGSGTLLDVAFICREILGHSDQHRFLGYLLLPDLFVGKPATHNVEANAYAAMKELDYFMDLGVTSKESVLLSSQRKIDIKKAPFDIAVVVNAANRDGQTFTDMHDVAQHLALSIFLTSGGVGKGAQDVLDNLRNFIGKEKFEGKTNHYCSIGLGELVFDRTRHADRVAMEFAARASTASFRPIAPSMSAESNDIEVMVDDFLNANNLVEHEKDQLIDALIKPGLFSPPSVEDVAKADLVRLVDGRAASRHGRESQLRAQIDSTRPEIEKIAIAAVDQRLKETLSRPGGVAEAEAFLNAMIGHLQNFRSEMDREAKTFRDGCEALTPHFKRLAEEAQEIQASFLPRGAAVREVGRRYGALLAQELNALFQSTRREAAAEVYAVIIDHARRKEAALAHLRNMLGSVQQQLANELEELKGRKHDMGTFTVSLPLPGDLIPEQLDPGAFLDWLRENDRDLWALSGMSVDQVVGCLKEFGQSRKEVSEVRKSSLKEVFKRLSSKDRLAYLKQLDQRAVPLWTYDDAAVNAKRTTETVSVIGVASEDDLPVSREDVAAAVRGLPPSFTEVGDPERIYLYRAEVAIPGFAIGGMHRYKARFDSQRRDTPFHIFPGFDEVSRDLFPSEGGEHAFLWWSLAIADVFRFVERNGAQYKLRSAKYGDPLNGFLLTIGQGRVNAHDAFMANREWVQEVGDGIEGIVKSKGQSVVASELRRYAEELIQEGSAASDARAKDLMRRELEAVRGFIADLTTVR
jgi:hypothetical protein